jgi:hypothetical protein
MCSGAFEGETLIFKSNFKCVWCDKKIRTMKFPKCEHHACFKCIKRVYGMYYYIDYPEFPYPNKTFDDYKWDDVAQEYPYKKDPVLKNWEEICWKIDDWNQTMHEYYYDNKKCAKCDKNRFI